MKDSSAALVAVALVLTGIMAATFARWQRALSDWRRTVASIPGLRRTTVRLWFRMVVFGAALAALLWVMIRR